MNKHIFIIILILIIIFMYIFKFNEHFQNNTGIFNYFYGEYLNPYSLPLTKFFSNDKIQPYY